MRRSLKNRSTSVESTGVTEVLAKTRVWDELDSAALEREISNAEEDVADAKTDERRQIAQEKLDHLKALRQAL